jgi:integrase/recombinase XerC
MPLMLEEQLKNTFQQWLLYLKSGKALSSHTLDAYQTDLLQFFTFLKNHLGEEITLKVFTSLKRTEVRSWLADRHHKEYNMRSTARSLSSIKNFFRYLQKQKIIEDHLIFDIKPPKRTKTLPRPLSVDQALDLVANINQVSDQKWVGERDKALFMLIYSAGLRISEALSLDVEIMKSDDFLVIRGKGSKFRKVPFLDNVKKQIKFYLQNIPFTVQSNSPLFIGVQGKRLRRSIAEAQMRKYRHLVQLPDSATPHSLRHSCASHLMAATGDLRSIQELLGHASLSTTQIYTEIDKDYLMHAYHVAHPRARSKD